VTDRESRLLRSRSGWIPGYKAQTACTVDQIIVAADVNQQSSDLEQLPVVLDAANEALAGAGINQRPDAVVADAGYWRIANVGLPRPPSCGQAFGQLVAAKVTTATMFWPDAPRPDIA
jgi:hypothetical protein